MTRRTTRWAAFICVLGVCGVALAATTGELSQPAGVDGCASSNGTDTEGGVCEDANLLNGARDVAVSPDGDHVYIAAEASSSIEVMDRSATGRLTARAPDRGCVHPAGALGCRNGRALSSPQAVALSPDGHQLYVVASNSDSVLVFDRDPVTGALEQKADLAGCVSVSGSSEDGADTCTDGRALDGATDIVVSPGGSSVYVAARGSRAIAVFDRGPAGAITQKGGTAGCISLDGASEDGAATCQNGRALDAPVGVAISPDGTNVYAAAIVESDAVLAFDRASDGALTQKPGTGGCVSHTGASEDGPATCQIGRELDNVASVVVSPDGAHVYAGALISGAVTAFDRDQASGTIVQQAGEDGCITVASKPGCQNGRAVSGSGLAIASDGRSLYAASNANPPGVAFLERSPITGGISQPAGLTGCASPDGTSEEGAGTCTDARAVNGPTGLTVSPDGGHVYVTAFSDAAVATFVRELPPTCRPGAFTIAHGLKAPLSILCEDPNGDPLSYAIDAGPSHGSLGAIDSAGRVIYTPPQGFAGADQFTVRATANGQTSLPATMALDVLGPGTGPTPRTVPPLAADAAAASLREIPYRVSRRRVVLPLSCPDAASRPCVWTIKLTTRGKVAIRGRKRGSKKRRRVRVTLVRGSLTIPAGGERMFARRLTRTARRVVGRRRSYPARLTLSRRIATTETLGRNVRLRAVPELVRVRRNRLRMRVPYPADTDPMQKARVSVRRGRKTLGTRLVTPRPGASANATVVLARKAAARVRRGTRLTLTVRTTRRDGSARTSRFALRVR